MFIFRGLERIRVLHITSIYQINYYIEIVEVLTNVMILSITVKYILNAIEMKIEEKVR